MHSYAKMWKMCIKRKNTTNVENTGKIGIFEVHKMRKNIMFICHGNILIGAKNVDL